MAAPWEVYQTPTGPSPKEAETEAGISQKRASAASSSASATEKTELLPAKRRKEQAAAKSAELKAAELEDKLAKMMQMASGRPVPSEVNAAREELLYEIGNLAKALDLSETMFGATGLGQAITSKASLSGSPALTLQALMKPIFSDTAFSALKKMRSESPTGAALGNVTEKELDLLKSGEGAADALGSDVVFQNDVRRFIKTRLGILGKLGVDPAAVAKALGPKYAPLFVDDIKSYRFDPRDEKAIANYIKKATSTGRFDPADYASYMVQAYQNATGNRPDENFMRAALQNGQQIQEQLATGKSGVYAGVNYNVADQAARKAFETQAQGLEETTTMSDALTGAAINVIPNSFEVALDTINALTLDLPQTIMGVSQVVGGALGITDKKALNSFVDYYTDRYGSMEGFKKALREEPASILADIAGIVTLGSTAGAKAATALSKATNIKAAADAARRFEGFGNFAAKLDPVAIAGRITAAGAKGAKNVGESFAFGLPARLTGTSPADIKQAVKAGAEGSTEFAEQLEGLAPPKAVLDKMSKAVTELYRKRQRDYQRKMRSVKANPETIDFNDIDAVIDEARDIGMHEGIDISSAADVWRQIDDKVAEFRNKGLNSVYDFDRLKQAIQSIYQNYNIGTPQYRVGRDVTRALGDAIRQKAPIYGEIMSDYATASDALEDITSTLSTGAGSLDTTLNKLLRASSGRGPRGRTILDVLEETRSGKGLSNAVSGLALSPTEPGGLSPTLTTAGAVATGSPEVLAANLITPRGVGRTAFKLGRGMKGASEAFMDLPGMRPAVDKASQLFQRYGLAVPKGVRAVNPLAIQPFTSDFEYEPPTEEEIRARLLAKYFERPAIFEVGQGPEISLEELRDKYPQGGAPSLEALIAASEEPAPAEEEETPFARGGYVIAPSIY